VGIRDIDLVLSEQRDMNLKKNGSKFYNNFDDDQMEEANIGSQINKIEADEEKKAIEESKLQFDTNQAEKAIINQALEESMKANPNIQLNANNEIESMDYNAIQSIEEAMFLADSAQNNQPDYMESQFSNHPVFLQAINLGYTANDVAEAMSNVGYQIDAVVTYLYDTKGIGPYF